MALHTTRRWALLLGVLSTLLIFLAFCTPYWLISADTTPQKIFSNLGLWEVCLNMSDPKHLYDHRFVGCWWIPLEDLFFMREQLLSPAFFVAVQVFFTFCLIFSILGCIMVFMYACCVAYDRRICILRSISAVFFVSALCGTIAVITFGARGDGRDWMPYPDHNYLSWSFGLAVVGTFFAWVAAILFWIEGNRTRRRQEKEEAYAMHSQSKA